MMEEGGDVVTKVVDNVRGATLKSLINQHVLPGATIFTDELKSYNGLAARGYVHSTVNYAAGQYVSPVGATVNSMEGFWAALKRRINGTHIHVSGRHLPKYLAEFDYRYDMRAVPQLMLDRLMVSFARQVGPSPLAGDQSGYWGYP